jgi:hypothetical protein
MQKGYKTSEFWVTIGTVVAGLLVATGRLSPENQDATAQAICQCIECVVGCVTALASVWKYTHSRQIIKSSKEKE